MNFLKLLFPWAVGTIILIDGFGILNDRNLIIWPIFVFSIILLFVLFKSKKIKIDSTLLLWIIFLLFSAISTALSANIQKSVTYFLFYLSLPQIFLFANLHKDYLQDKLIKLIISISFLAIIASVFIESLNLIPQNGYQLIFASFGSHNHLGDFLVLPLIISIYLMLTKSNHKYRLILILYVVFNLPFFLFSFSRSAYLSLAVTLLIMIYFLWKDKKLSLKPTSLILLIFTLGISTIFIFAVVKSQDKTLSNVHSVLVTKNLGNKSALSSRNYYIEDSLNSIKENGIFGIGPGNYPLVSKIRPDNPVISESSHNLFLDIFVEIGIVAGIVFVLLIFGLLIKSKRDIYFFLSLVLVINFQTDYTYRIFSLFLLFILFLAVSPEDN